jgi:hypothetical protein
MIIKKTDDKTPLIHDLERLLGLAPSIVRPRIEQELRAIRAGIKGEQEAAYLIDFDLRDSKNTCVIHDLRIEIKGRVAQIDHLLIHRSMKVYVVETKHFHAGIKVTETGEFMQWNSYKKTYEGIPSPFAQNERHIAVLKDVFSTLIDLPTRLGVKLEPEFHSIVAVAPSARIERPKNFDTSNLVKADQLIQKLDDQLKSASLLSAVAKLVSEDTLIGIAKQLIRFHRPAHFNYAAKFALDGIPANEAANKPASSKATSPSESAQPIKKSDYSSNQLLVCRKCNSSNITIQYGKYGYYFKCAKCESNTPINIGCGHEGHKERLRKDGAKFFRECVDCGTSKLYFENSIN